MNLLQLILKQMRQRALGTTLTLLSVLLGVALAVSILLLRRGGQSLFAQTEFGFDVIAGTRASPLQLVLNTVYHIDQSPGNVPYWVYEQINTQERSPRGSKEFNYHKHVRTAVPIAVGDSYKGRPIIGAPPKMFVSLEGLAQRVEALAERQRAMEVKAFGPPPTDEQLRDLIAKQAAMGAEFDALRKEINRVGAEVIPLVEVVPPATITAADAAAMGTHDEHGHDHAHGGHDHPATAPATNPATSPATTPATTPSGELLAGGPKKDDHHGHDHHGHDHAHDHDHGGPKKWRYGTPVVLRCDEAVIQVSEAAEALARKDVLAARAAQKEVVESLATIARTVAAHSGPLYYRPDKTYELAQGRVYHAWRFEAVIGSEVAEKSDLRLGSKFQATHGMPTEGQTPDVHAEQWEVVGVMKRTGTAADRCLFIPLVSFYTIGEHEEGLEAHERARLGQAAQSVAPKPAAHDHAGHDHHHHHTYELAYGDALCPGLPHTKDFIDLEIPPNKWEVSAILIKARSPFMADQLAYHLQNGGLRDTTGVIPARVMREFFDTFLSSSATVLLLIALLVSVVAGVGILVSIYNSVAARNREIAILRALGATRGRVLLLICAEAALIGVIGGILGLLVGHLLGAVASSVMMRQVGQGFDWVNVGKDEVLYLGLVVLIAVLAGLVPALKAYRTPVATNLVAG